LAKRRLRTAPAAEPVHAQTGWPWGSLAVSGVLVLLAIVAGLGLQAAVSQRPSSGALAKCSAPAQVAPRVYVSAPAMCIDPSKSYQAVVKTTKGDMTVQLFASEAPKTVNDFVVLAGDGYYNGLTFWQVQDWMVQTGDPTGTGRFSPGFTLPEEKGHQGWAPGSLGYARQGASINGGQFFITKTAWPGGDPTQSYNHFGTVVIGADIIGQLTKDDRVISITVKQV
jgi:cyclophilin family peptidyl-prolyl cis-trans isomerase